MQPAPILAADTGGTLIKLGIVQNGQVLAQSVIPAHSDRPLADRLPAVADAWRELCLAAGTPLEACGGIGISFPSIMDPASGRVLTHFGKFADAPDLDLKAWARQQFNLPLSIDNDARTALIGEWQYGAGRNCDDLVMITLGTGLGSAALCGGVPLRGGHGQAAIMAGHSSIAYQGQRCPFCGNLGCAEREASTSVLPQMAQRTPGFAQSALAKEGTLDYAAVFRLAAAGDACATALRDHSLLVWGTHAANLVLAFDPARVIIGGGICNAPEVLPAIQKHIHTHALTPWGKVEVMPSQLGDAAALLGCEWLGRNA